MILKKKNKYLVNSLMFLFLIFIFIVILNFISPNNILISSLKSFVPESIKTPIKEKILHLRKQEMYKNFYYENKDQLRYLSNRVNKLEVNKGLINERIFPDTQFLNLFYEETFLNLDITQEDKNTSPFYIIILKEKILVITKYGKFFLTNLNELQKKKILEINMSFSKIFDAKIFKDELYISTQKNDELKNCVVRAVYKAKINNEKLNFENFYSHSECGQSDNGGIMYFDANNQSLIISVPDDKIRTKGKYDNPTSFLRVNLNNKKFQEISKGHRNPQGLFITENNIIISTEHGPRGGDEINNIKEGKNYGWPISSYGEKYKDIFKNDKEFDYKKEHKTNGFEEPIFAFVPSIGISQIIKVPNDFSFRWKDSFLITSLKARSIFRVNFDKSFSKVIFIEKIYVGKRIRDIEYLKDIKSFVLALEDDGGYIGIIKIK